MLLSRLGNSRGKMKDERGKRRDESGNSKFKIIPFLSLGFMMKDVDETRHSTEPDKASNGITNGIFRV